jgi:hypothetical protein
MTGLAKPLPMADRELRPHADGAQRLLAGLPLFHFGLIMADPNWLFATWSEKGEYKGPSTHYDCTPTEEIASGGDQLGVFDGGGKRTRRPRPAPEPAPAPLIDALGGGR